MKEKKTKKRDLNQKREKKVGSLAITDWARLSNPFNSNTALRLEFVRGTR